LFTIFLLVIAKEQRTTHDAASRTDFTRTLSTQKQLGNNAGRQTWLAVDLATQTRERVIVKLLPFSPQLHWDDLKLFEREAQVLKHLNHPCIPKYRDYFSTEPSNSGELPWFGLVQDYIPGDSLQQLLKKGKRFTEAGVKEIAIQLLKY
jgi:serine/threonine protein kinase